VFASPAEASRQVKAAALEAGADIVGICEIGPENVYHGRTVSETYAIAVGQRMRWREFQVVPSRESAIECLRVYFTLGETVIRLAAHLRAIGYPCRVEHPIGDSDLLHIPIGLKAGFGELGRHGSIIHPSLAPLFRMGSVITSIPLEIDHTGDAGIAKFCDACRACRKFCPPQAIPTPDAAFPTSHGITTARSTFPSAPTTTRSGPVTSAGPPRRSSPRSSCTTRHRPPTSPTPSVPMTIRG
jgi:ferredoxin